MASIKKDYNTMGLPMNITRGNPIPVDSTEIWYSLEEAKEYALNGKTSYVGQTIKVVDEATGKIDTYVIGTDGSLINNTASVETDLGELKETVSNNTSRISTLEARLFVGTHEEYKTAYAAGKIPIGTIVIFTDDEGDSSGGSDNEGDSDEGLTSPKLGTGALGYMVLA